MKDLSGLKAVRDDRVVEAAIMTNLTDFLIMLFLRKKNDSRAKIWIRLEPEYGHIAA